VSVIGKRDDRLLEENYLKKIYARDIDNQTWTAIQITTASSICAVADIVLSQPEKYHGFIPQETFSLPDIYNNRFGQCYKEENSKCTF
jgi:saccharopine dehydrogenase-like NADP-dependent oxidoreductase